ncbi:hypothetical protein C5E08_09895 [Rathayibacter iranicus]|uniref:Uncharacterized protein n=3 Tax=Rathayibacter iranicus TaxID=59737 RepID=A0AAD1EMK8_9MICO|nr:hypothetical protein C7V51_09980 [Rathayibacter iranicus]PPI46244.1 hypothetical protein C5E09_08975 [Rathayibacter iranicus]PPI59618.1 hypothetical protein C5E08_09895 [Rathayibacter iranicus]PPI71096.1 hypothetical protein C5E01_08940 [Rathayibacter iranicus]
MRTPGRNRRGRVRRLFLALAAVSVCGGVISSGAVPANAVSEFRMEVPLNAGTRIGLPRGNCTVGAVLASKSWYMQISARLKATRYVAAAGHCGNVGDDVSVGQVGTVGKVIWKARVADIMIARIDPLARNSYHCAGSSTLHNCSPMTTFTPRAIGNVFLYDHTGEYASVPVAGFGAPEPNETFCTSGAVSGVNCTWFLDPDVPLYQPLVLGASTKRKATLDGDSGGPVVSRGGQLYGFISKGGKSGTRLVGFMTFVPISRLFEEQRGYELAPPG